MGILHLTKNDFDSTIDSGTVLVDFWAGWCAPCKMLSPVIESVADAYGETVKVAKVDVDAEGELAVRYGIMGIPTVLLFRDGKEVKRFVGVQPEDVYTEALTQAHDMGVEDMEDVNLSEEE